MLVMSDSAQFADVPKVTRQQMTTIFSMGAKGGVFVLVQRQVLNVPLLAIPGNKRCKSLPHIDCPAHPPLSYPRFAVHHSSF
jgi:hypothetical protein